MTGSETISSSCAPRAPCITSCSNDSLTVLTCGMCERVALVSRSQCLAGPSGVPGIDLACAVIVFHQECACRRRTYRGEVGGPDLQTFDAHGHTKDVEVLVEKGYHSVSQRMAMWGPWLACTPPSRSWPRFWTGGPSSGAPMGARACVHGCMSSVVAYSEIAGC